MEDRSMLLVLPVPLRRQGSATLFEAQACNGLQRWAENFARLVVAVPTMPEELAEQDRTIDWRDIRDLPFRDQVELVSLPWGYRISDFARQYRSTRHLLGDLIDRCHFLQFAVGGWLGDWGAAAALEARRRHRDFAVHVEGVAHAINLRSARGQGLGRRLKTAALTPLTRWHDARVIHSATLALMHGMETYRSYQGLCGNSHVIHDIHVKPDAFIGADALEVKANRVAAGGPLRLCYAGRMINLKAPLDWLRALALARDLGTEFEACWLGDGPLLEPARELVGQLNLTDRVRLCGFVSDRAALMSQLKDADLMPFCHIAPESPRCLIEALIAGTPIVGYTSAYATDLTVAGGGVFVPVHDWRGLGRQIAALAADRPRLADLIRAAGRSGSHFSDEAVFRHRSDLLKRYLGAVPDARTPLHSQV